MRRLYDRTAAAMARRLATYAGRRLHGSQRLDDGSELRVTLDFAASGKVTVDFSGTAPVHGANLNATPAIVRSVVLYVLRLLPPGNYRVRTQVIGFADDPPAGDTHRAVAESVNGSVATDVEGVTPVG